MKLNFFKFNNVNFKSRVFDNYAEHIDRLLPETVLPGWLELFATDFYEEDDICQERLFRLVGMGCKTLMTTRHFVDEQGEAWPQETFVVLEDERPNTRFVLVVACERTSKR